MFGLNLKSFIVLFTVVSVSSFIIFQSDDSYGAGRQKYKYLGNAGCKCHLSRGCFEGEEYKERLHSHTFNERLKTDEDKKNPECLKCHATALNKRIRRGKSKYGRFIEDVACEACHGPGGGRGGYVRVKKNYKRKGKDAFKKLLKEDPMMARKVQYDAGLFVAGINKYETIKEQCLECHWEDEDAKNRCPKAIDEKTGKPKVMKFRKYFKKDDHRDHDAIDDVLAKMSSSEKRKWKGYIEQDPLFKTRPSNVK